VEALAVVTPARAAAAVACAALSVWPRLATACPSCAANPDDGVARYVLIGLMVAAPYLAATFVIRFIRKGEAEMRAQESARTRRAEPSVDRLR
jgi:hypothetical protein